MSDTYINIILDYARQNNKSPAMAYMDLVLADKEHCLQYSEALEIIYTQNITA